MGYEPLGYIQQSELLELNRKVAVLKSKGFKHDLRLEGDVVQMCGYQRMFYKTQYNKIDIYHAEDKRDVLIDFLVAQYLYALYDWPRREYGIIDQTEEVIRQSEYEWVLHDMIGTEINYREESLLSFDDALAEIENKFKGPKEALREFKINMACYLSYRALTRNYSYNRNVWNMYLVRDGYYLRHDIRSRAEKLVGYKDGKLIDYNTSATILFEEDTNVFYHLLHDLVETPAPEFIDRLFP